MRTALNILSQGAACNEISLEQFACFCCVFELVDGTERPTGDAFVQGAVFLNSNKNHTEENFAEWCLVDE